jgi:hypothetical protein
MSQWADRDGVVVELGGSSMLESFGGMGRLSLSSHRLGDRRGASTDIPMEMTTNGPYLRFILHINLLPPFEIGQ